MAKRHEVPLEDTWNLDDLFATEAAFNDALENVKNRGLAFVKKYQGQIKDAKTPDILLESFHELKTIMGEASPVMLYAMLDFSADMTDADKRRRSMETQAIFGMLQGELSFYPSEMNLLPEALLEQCANIDAEAATFFNDMLRERPYRLSPETEKVLSSLSQSIFDLPYQLYSSAKLADLSFPDFEVKDKIYPLSFALYEEKYAYDRNTDLRRKAFEVFSEELGRYRNTLATGYFAKVQSDVIMAKLRGYDNVFDYLLLSHKVDYETYLRQVEVIMAELSPHMRRYARKMKENWKLETLRYDDLKLPPLPGMDQPVTQSEAKNIVSDTLAIMGEDYQKLLLSAFEDRWFDFAANEGKSTGGFCAVPYKNHAYILLNWNGLLADVYTLVHELGHAAQGMLAQQERHFFDADPTLYYIEAPSTFHEVLLNDRLLSEAKTKEERQVIAARAVANTYYHNFVTHFIEAAWQHEVYKAVSQGAVLTADDFDRMFLDTLKQFWGDEVEMTPGAERTWMRQPHYYTGLYSYTYSAGLTVSTAAGKRIQREGQQAAKDWIKMLKLGGTMKPEALAKEAGVDITTDAALKETIAWIGQLVDEI